MPKDYSKVEKSFNVLVDNSFDKNGNFNHDNFMKTLYETLESFKEEEYEDCIKLLFEYYDHLSQAKHMTVQENSPRYKVSIYLKLYCLQLQTYVKKDLTQVSYNDIGTHHGIQETGYIPDVQLWKKAVKSYAADGAKFAFLVSLLKNHTVIVKHILTLAMITNLWRDVRLVGET